MTHDGNQQGGGCAVVIGAQGGIGAAFMAALQARPDQFSQVLGFGRHTGPALNLLDEASIAQCAAQVAGTGLPLRLVIDATGFLHGQGFEPEKTMRQIDPAHMAHAFAINAIGPALLMKHFLPLMPRQGAACFATLSAKVGSIGDNRLGGWYSYRAAKAALNQLVRTASVELQRRAPQAVCVALHPGTVDTGLSQPFGKQGLKLHTPEECAANLLAVIDGFTPEATGRFWSWDGTELPW